MILDLWGMVFHAMVAFGLGLDLLFKSIWACCVSICQLIVDKNPKMEGGWTPIHVKLPKMVTCQFIVENVDDKHPKS